MRSLVTLKRFVGNNMVKNLSTVTCLFQRFQSSTVYTTLHRINCSITCSRCSRM